MGRDKVIRGVNDLETYCKQNGKEYLLKEWHPTKNGGLKPSDVSFGSGKKVWWYLPYDDIKTGKHFIFEWETTLVNRIKGARCPYLCGQQVYQGFNDLETYCKQNGKEYLLKEWHPFKNGNLKPSNITVNSGKKVWWLLSYDDIRTKKHFNFEWENAVGNRVKGEDCPYLSGRKVYKGFNDLATLYPQISKEWHPTKNGCLKPSDVTAGSEKKVWWYLPYDDNKTGKHFNFEWEATIASRVQGNGCPYIKGKAVWKGYNDLESQYPEIAKEWHPTKNGSLKPSDVSVGSHLKVWWFLPYDDINTGRHFNFEWACSIRERIAGYGCPYLSGRQLYKGFNDLKSCYPQIAKEWHPTKNGNLKPTDVMPHSNKKVWWFLPYDDIRTGKHFDFEWETTVNNRVKGKKCPYLCMQKLYKGFNDLESVCPNLRGIWHPTKNDNLKPSDMIISSQQKVWWLGDCKHEWLARVRSMVNGMVCPYCSGSKTERLLYEFCKKNEIAFIAEKKFVNEMKIKAYPFDLYLYKNKLILEADGIQHFIRVKHFAKTNLDFLERVRKDNIKNEYCLKHKIPILRIPYIYDIIKDKTKIEGFVEEFIKTRKVSQEILDYYKQYKESIGSNYYDVASELNMLVL